MYYCPRCHARLYKGEFGWNCHNCLLSVPFIYRGYRLPATELKLLLKKGQTSLLHHWKRSDGKGQITGYLTFQEDYALRFVPKLFENVLCPNCDNTLLESENGICCSFCDFFLWRKVAQRELSTSEIRSLLLYGRSELLHRFVNRESGKFFSAKLLLEKNGSVTFLKE